MYQEKKENYNIMHLSISVDKCGMSDVFIDKMIHANSADLDQMAPEEAV